VETVSLYELNEFIRRVLALNFRELVWIRAEVLQAKFSKEHCYIDLVEKDTEKDQVIAQSGAVIWRTTYAKMFLTHKSLLQELLQPGLELRLLVKVEYDERYGLKLNIQDIDPNYTIGKLAIQRRQTLEILQKENLLTRNRQLLAPDVFQHIAVISSENAAGWIDFSSHLTKNPYQYAFQITFFPAAVQGQEAEKEIVKRIAEIQRNTNYFDAIIIIRGGGSKLDLNAFDGLEIARAIATSSLPVLTGIGHEIDESVADLVAWRSFKTPTAVADFLLHQHLVFENKVWEVFEKIQDIVKEKVRIEENRLVQMTGIIRNAVLNKISKAENQLALLSLQLKYVAGQQVTLSHNKLNLLSASLDNLHPENIMKRGYSLVLKGDKIVKSSGEIKTDDELKIRFSREEIRVKKV
jgi:exodeoxyribonuclease VII large subunit